MEKLQIVPERYFSFQNGQIVKYTVTNKEGETYKTFGVTSGSYTIYKDKAIRALKLLKPRVGVYNNIVKKAVFITHNQTVELVMDENELNVLPELEKSALLLLKALKSSKRLQLNYKV